MTKILFICHGNICRSPMAEYIFKDMVRKARRENEFYIASAATSAEEIGNPIYPPVKRLLQARGISCNAKRAVQVRREDYDRYDYIVCMDKNNLRNLQLIFGGDPQNKIARLMDYTDQPRDVADPWYTRDFAAAQRDICAGCHALLAQVH